MYRTQEKRKTGKNNITHEMQTRRNTETDGAFQETEGERGNIKNRCLTKDFRR